MKLEDAIILARMSANNSHLSTGADNARHKLIMEARAMVREHGEKLVAAAVNKAEAERVLVDIQVYGDACPSESRMWVKRVFSDGHVTKCMEPEDYARQLKHTFEQGKKAADLARNAPQCPPTRDDFV